MTARPDPAKARQATARLYAAVAAPAPAATDLAQTPPPKGGLRPAARPGRPHRAPLGDLLRGLPWAPADRPA